MIGIGMAFLALSACWMGGLEAEKLKVKPEETDELFANPGMGWQTFHTFADEDKNLGGLPSASAYFRFYWRQVEPEEGKIDFARFDALLARARKAGQKLAFRLKKGEKASVFVTETSIKGWLPGRSEKTEVIELPGELKPGRYELELGIVDPSAKTPAVRLAISGRAADGWYPVSALDVIKKP
jgi:hypothetical protein